MRSHVHDPILEPMDDQSLRGQALVTHSSQEPTSHGITLSRHDVLEASHTRRASPLLAGLFAGITSDAGNSIGLPDKEFRYLRTVHCGYSSSEYLHLKVRLISGRLSRSTGIASY